MLFISTIVYKKFYLSFILDSYNHILFLNLYFLLNRNLLKEILNFLVINLKFTIYIFFSVN